MSLNIPFQISQGLPKKLSVAELTTATEQILTESLEEKVTLLIIRDLMRLDWKASFSKEAITISPPEFYDKKIIRDSMAIKRMELINKDKEWIDRHLSIAQGNLAEGKDVLRSSIRPVIEVCTTKQQHRLFRILRYYWSSPYSEYVGRRMRLIIRDAGLANKPVIGIAALGSSIVHIPERDDWVGWNLSERTENLIYSMDAYILGALPPYNHLLGGKLISYLMTSQELREEYEKKYMNKVTQIRQRKASDLACLFTTSLYGRSSQYNRLKYRKRLLYVPVGETKGFGTLHLSDETFEAMRELLESQNILVTNRFGDGPNWRMRVMRSVGNLLQFDADILLQHSFKRSIYAIPLARNTQKFLQGKETTLKYYNHSLKNLVAFWKKRWLRKRKARPEVREQVEQFTKSDFQIY